MTAFPSTYAVDSKGYSVEPNDGTSASRADDGTLRIRRLYASTRFAIKFRLYKMTSTDTEAVLLFYESNKNQQITWTDPFTSVVYSVLMTEPPSIIDVSGLWSEMEVRMEGVRQ